MRLLILLQLCRPSRGFVYFKGSVQLFQNTRLTSLVISDLPAVYWQWFRTSLIVLHQIIPPTAPLTDYIQTFDRSRSNSIWNEGCPDVDAQTSVLHISGTHRMRTNIVVLQTLNDRILNKDKAICLSMIHSAKTMLVGVNSTTVARLS